jgi:hypothetical protein
VLGIGHLAAAVRLELACRGLKQDSAPSAEPLIVACSDFTNPASFNEASRLAGSTCSPILYACLPDTAQLPRAQARRGALKVVDRVAAWLASAVNP